MTHPDIPEEIRGTYAAIAHPAMVIDHLKSLGVTAIELMPVHQFVNDSTLIDKGLSQLLGLQHDRLLRPALRVRRHQHHPGRQVQEFKAMVKALHEAGHRGDPRRGLQPHRRGQPPGPDAVDARHRQRRLLPARRRRQAATTWTTPAPATASTCGTRTSCS
jgi:hypothetical protein